MIAPGEENRGLGAFLFRREGLRRDFAVGLLQQDFDFRFSLFEFFLAFTRKLHAFLEQAHRLIERKVGAFEALDDFLEPRERFLELALALRLGGFVWR